MSSSPIPVPTPSTPLDPSKLNQTPATLSTDPSTTNTSSALRSPEEPTSAYLDSPSEPPSHPTVAETGLATSPGKDAAGPGPKSGQLRRVPGGEKKDQEVIHLGSFGGDGLKAKPPGPVGVQPKSPEISTFNVTA